MTIEQFIEKAIEGGWLCENYCDANEMYAYGNCEAMLLDPLAWQAVGKAIGVPGVRLWALDTMHRLVDALAEGKTIEQFLETLYKNPL